MNFDLNELRDLVVVACCSGNYIFLIGSAYALDSPCITGVIRVIWNRAMVMVMMYMLMAMLMRIEEDT